MESNFPMVIDASGPQGQREIDLGLYKTIIINVIVFCGLFLLIELSYVVWLQFMGKPSALEPVYRFLAPDPITGYSPVDGTFVIRQPGWDNVTITIRQGVRVNPNFTPASAGGAILAVGDSFVFGDQVSDDETWPAILERRLKRRVVNGGVSGYGTAQAVLRAERLLKAERYSLLILSILVHGDLSRDQMVVDGRPVVIREDGRLRQTSVEESRRIVSENFICRHPWLSKSFFWSHIANLFSPSFDYNLLCTYLTHPKAATVSEILEFAVERLAAFPVNKAILLQYPRYSFEGHSGAAENDAEETRMIRDAAVRHGVPVIDTYDRLKNKPPRETYIYSDWWPHHSKKGNEVVADLIAREIRSVLLPGPIPVEGAPGVSQPTLNQ
jgi:hypothetical protein